MRTHIAWILVAILLLGTAPIALAGGNMLRNTDFKEGSQLWRGDAQEAYLKPDGTEGTELDKDAVPVLRVSLSHGQRRAVYQDFRMTGAPRHLDIQVEVYASLDFKRSVHAEDYVSDDYSPNADFGCRLLPDYNDRTAELKPGKWTTVKLTIPIFQASDEKTLIFFIPPGSGVVYIKNPSATP